MCECVSVPPSLCSCLDLHCYSLQDSLFLFLLILPLLLRPLLHFIIIFFFFFLHISKFFSFFSPFFLLVLSPDLNNAIDYLSPLVHSGASKAHGEGDTKLKRKDTDNNETRRKNKNKNKKNEEKIKMIIFPKKSRKKDKKERNERMEKEWYRFAKAPRCKWGARGLFPDRKCP